jgi:hypothetical protein
MSIDGDVSTQQCAKARMTEEGARHLQHLVERVRVNVAVRAIIRSRTQANVRVQGTGSV